MLLMDVLITQRDTIILLLCRFWVDMETFLTLHSGSDMLAFPQISSIIPHWFWACSSIGFLGSSSFFLYFSSYHSWHSLSLNWFELIGSYSFSYHLPQVLLSLWNSSPIFPISCMCYIFTSFLFSGTSTPGGPTKFIILLLISSAIFISLLRYYYQA